MLSKYFIKVNFNHWEIRDSQVEMPARQMDIQVVVRGPLSPCGSQVVTCSSIPSHLIVLAAVLIILLGSHSTCFRSISLLLCHSDHMVCWATLDLWHVIWCLLRCCCMRNPSTTFFYIPHHLMDLYQAAMVNILSIRNHWFFWGSKLFDS
jgi:hypothetical protein